MNTALEIAIVCVAAIVVGPWLGILADRCVDRVTPQAEHRCASCRHGLGLGSLVPLVHWRQKCTACGKYKGSRYVAVDVLTLLGFGVLAARFGLNPVLVPYLALAAVLAVLTVVDAETHLLPNVIVWPSIWVGLAIVLSTSSVLEVGGIRSALVGAATFSGVIGITHVIYSKGMGRGDVKLALLLGLFIGWAQSGLLDTATLVLYAILGSLLLGAVVGIVYNALMKRGRAEIPFGPALVVGSMAIIVFAPQVLGVVRA